MKSPRLLSQTTRSPRTWGASAWRRETGVAPTRRSSEGWGRGSGSPSGTAVCSPSSDPCAWWTGRFCPQRATLATCQETPANFALVIWMMRACLKYCSLQLFCLWLEQGASAGGASWEHRNRSWVLVQAPPRANVFTTDKFLQSKFLEKVILGEILQAKQFRCNQFAFQRFNTKTSRYQKMSQSTADSTCVWVEWKCQENHRLHRCLRWGWRRSASGWRSAPSPAPAPTTPWRDLTAGTEGVLPAKRNRFSEERDKQNSSPSCWMNASQNWMGLWGNPQQRRQDNGLLMFQKIELRYSWVWSKTKHKLFSVPKSHVANGLFWQRERSQNRDQIYAFTTIWVAQPWDFPSPERCDQLTL